MVMDFLRTAYKTTFKWNGSDPHTSTVRWYRAPPGAQVFPGQHRFGSGNYSRQIGVESPFGEQVQAPRTWDRGAPPCGILGTNFCGSQGQFLSGAPVLATPIDSRADGQPACCAGPSCVVVPCCPGIGIPQNLTARFSNGTGLAVALNGAAVPIQWDGTINWVGNATLCGLASQVQLRCDLTAHWFVTVFGIGVGTQQVASYTCQPFTTHSPGRLVNIGCTGTIDIDIS